MEPTHASFFSGVGGLDLGLERAGWRTVSFSEIDPYASAVLAERWPGVPNLGDITELTSIARTSRSRQSEGRWHGPTGSATLWSGGFPCQDLSVAGKRAGLGLQHNGPGLVERGARDVEGRRGRNGTDGASGDGGDRYANTTRSGLAFAFLDLVERHRPPAILLENVPGLLSSHGGRDFGALLGAMGQLGYWWAYRILDARHFGVPQRRRRVFIVGLHAERGFGADSAAAVLSVGTRCGRHPATGHSKGEGVAERAGDGSYLPQSINAKWSKGYSGPAGDEHHNLTLSAPPDSGGVRETDGLARGVDHSPLAFRKAARVSDPGSPETWVDDGIANTLNSFDVGDIRTTHIAVDRGSNGPKGAATTCPDLLPLGLDSHRYRCCGNGVVAPVSEWIGWRLRRAVEGMKAAA